MSDTMRAAYDLCGRLLDQLPDGVRIASWEIADGYVGGQYSLLDSESSPKTGLRSAATVLGLVYDERRQGSLTSIEAAGELDGIRVQLWAHLPASTARHAAVTA